MRAHPHSIERLRRLATGGLVAAAMLGGCRQAYVDRPIQSLVPAGATRVAEGRPPVGWPVRGAGRIFILDLDANALVFSGAFQESAEAPRLILVDPQERAVIARKMDTEEQHVLLRPIEPEHRFAIWFLTAGQPASGPVDSPSN